MQRARSLGFSVLVEKFHSADQLVLFALLYVLSQSRWKILKS